MAIQHASIADADRHENKHASGATNGHVLKANGDGTTGFAAPSTLQNVTIASTAESSSFTSQGPTAVDTPYQITWGAGTANSDVSIASNGLINITTTGLYSLTVSLNMGRTGVTGVATLVSRLLVNDVAFGSTRAVRIDTSANITTVHYTILRRFTAGDVIRAEVVRDSSTQNDGGLIAVDPVIADWETSPSAGVRIQRLLGGY